MWNSIKNLFTGSTKESKNKETQLQLLQELESYKKETEQSKQKTEQYKIKFEAVVKEIRKLRQKTDNQDEEIHHFRIKEQQQLTKEIEDKEELDSKTAIEERIRNDDIKKEVMQLQMGSRNRHYNDFIHWTFQEILDKKEKENHRPPSNNHIILDACIIIDPYNNNGNHFPLMDLLNKIEKLRETNIIQPILYKKLIFEYTNLYEIEDLTIFPALEMVEYFNSSIRILDTSTNIETRKNQIHNKLSQSHKQQFLENSQQRNFENDILHAAIAQYLECPLVTNDIALLRLALNPNKNLKIYHNSTDPQYRNYPHIDAYLNNISQSNHQ
jgi:hypothetical protein